jgi:hypothetical protein
MSKDCQPKRCSFPRGTGELQMYKVRRTTNDPKQAAGVSLLIKRCTLILAMGCTLLWHVVTGHGVASCERQLPIFILPIAMFRKTIAQGIPVPYTTHTAKPVRKYLDTLQDQWSQKRESKWFLTPHWSEWFEVPKHTTFRRWHRLYLDACQLKYY